jgi:hypothetical protein
MGEEKPDEELMGKRKPAPRLSTTFCDVDNYMMARKGGSYTWLLKKISTDILPEAYMR